MGQFTPNIGLYIPSAGETNYTDSFASGMLNLDSHDHSGGPNKGLPITTTGLADFSVTYDKLNSNVVDPTTGIGVNSTPGLQNQLQLLGILKNLFTLSTLPGVGFISMNGSVVAGRTFTDTASVKWTFGDGVSGDPTADVDTSAFFPVTVPNGGTGLTTLNAYALMAAGTTATGNMQQVSGLGTSGQALLSNGPGVLPSWQTIVIPPQNLLVQTITLTDAQITAMDSSFFRVTQQVLAAQGAGKVIVPYQVYAKLNYAGVDAFHGGSSVRLFYGTSGSAPEVGFNFASGCFKDTNNAYYYAQDDRAASSSGVTLSTWENKSLNICVNSSSFTGGAGNTITFYITYSIMQI